MSPCNRLSLETYVFLQQLVADEPVEVQDFRKSTDDVRGMYRIHLKSTNIHFIHSGLLWTSEFFLHLNWKEASKLEDVTM